MNLRVSDIIKMAETQLAEAGIENAKLEAEQIYCQMKKYDKAKFFMKWSREASEIETENYFTLIAQRAARKPIQQIMGATEFMGYPFTVRENVLIPRMETEVLVAEALKYVKKKDSVLDLCCGSGVIGISIYRQCTEKGIPVKVVCSDVSEDAIKLTEDNCILNKVKIEVIRSNLFEALRKKKYNMIISNPPYIKSSVIPELEIEVREYDPILALDGGQDGLDFYRWITAEAPAHLKNGGMLIFEIGHDQGEDVKKIMENEGFSEIEIIRDLTGRDRVVRGIIN